MRVQELQCYELPIYFLFLSCLFLFCLILSDFISLSHLIASTLVTCRLWICGLVTTCFISLLAYLVFYSSRIFTYMYLTHRPTSVSALSASLPHVLQRRYLYGFILSWTSSIKSRQFLPEDLSLSSSSSGKVYLTFYLAIILTSSSVLFVGVKIQQLVSVIQFSRIQVV